MIFAVSAECSTLLGDGMMLAAIPKANPQLRGTLFDLPRVVENASNSLITENVADRCKIVGGDMFASVPHGGDLYLLSRVIHDWDIRVPSRYCALAATRWGRRPSCLFSTA
jgi:hypothetical protein